MCDALFTLPTAMNAQRQRWRGAIYIAPTNGLPQWFAVRIEYQSMPKPKVRESEAVRVDDERIPIECTLDEHRSS